VTRYPHIEPYEHGMLDVGDGHLVYWEVCGNPDGKPAELVLLGGVGHGTAYSGASAALVAALDRFAIR